MKNKPMLNDVDHSNKSQNELGEHMISNVSAKDLNNYGGGPSQKKQNLQNKWEIIKSSYQIKYPELKDDDVVYKKGQFELMTERIARRTNRDTQSVKNEIHDWDY